MRFFTNDRDTTDRDDEGDPRERGDDAHPERVASDPVAVPQQRPASPWAQTPRHGEQAVDEQARAEDLTGTPAAGAEPEQPTPPGQPGAPGQPDRLGPPDQLGQLGQPGAQLPEDALTDRGTFDDPVVLGGSRDAGTPATGAHAADDNGPGPVRIDRPDITETPDTGYPDARRAADRDAGGGAPAGLEEPALGERRRAATEGDDGDDTDADRPTVDPGAVAAAPATPAAVAAATAAGPTTAGPTTAGPTTAGPTAGGITGGVAAAAPADAGRKTDDGGLVDDGTFDDPKVAGGGGPDIVDGGTFSDPVVVEPGAPARTFAAEPQAAAAEAGSGPLFTDPDGFRNRWREVQLRFVDDPRDAADEAASLVDEAVDALTAALRQQRARLGETEATDTEQLRLRIRAYRDFLDRLLAL